MIRCPIHPSIGRVFQRHPACKGASICHYIFVFAPLQDDLALVAELKLIVKQDPELKLILKQDLKDVFDLDVPKFKFFAQQSPQ